MACRLVLKNRSRINLTFFFLLSGVGLSLLGTAATPGLLY
jgi:hypothetical protein